MAVSRRKALVLAGGGVVLAAAAGIGAFAATRTPHRALKPWSLAGSYGEPRLDALSWALLAPNPHNRQPWLAELRGRDEVLIWQDPSRGLPHTDPFGRQLAIGMGCFLELMVIAAAESGHGVVLDLYPGGEEGPVARARFTVGTAAPDPLFAAVPHRRSCKEPYEDRALAPADVADLASYATIVTDPVPVAEIRALTWDAWLVEAHTPHTMQESVDLMRFGKAEIEANPDGIDLGGPLLEGLMLAGIMTRGAQADPDSMTFQQGVAIYDTMLHATPAYAVLTSAANSRADQIAAGRAWLRLNLAATSRGVALHPISQALQEYPEMAGHYARAHELMAAPGETVQMLGRLGYGPEVAATPRWPLETRMRDV